MHFIGCLLELVECTYKEGEWEQKGSWSKYYVAKYASNAKNQTKTGKEIKEQNEDLYNAIMEGIKDETSGFLGGIWDDITGFFDWSAEVEWTKVDSNCGYQIRCVKE